MKIKSQAYLLIVGSIVIPLFIFGMSSIIFQLDERIDYDIPSYEEIRAVAGNFVDEREWDSIRSHISHRYPDSNVVVLTPDWRVIYSSVATFAQGQVLGNADILKFFEGKRNAFDFRYSAVPHSEGKVFTFVQYPHAGSIGMRPSTKRLVLTVGLVLVALLAFYVVMVIFITRSIAISVVELEEATRRVADGDFDLSIEAKGSNEITSLKASLNSLRLKIKEEQARRARFIMSVTHDLKTPLALIRGYVEALRDDLAASPRERNDYLEIIRKKSEALEDLIDDLIDFLRVDTGEWRASLKETALTPLLSAFSRRMKADAQLLRRGFEADLRLPQDLKVLMDERLINRCLENLVNNALRYTGENGSVVLAAEPAGPDRPGLAWLLRIRDDGPGIDGKDIDHIFELFYRGTNSRREQGNGLGLATVKAILDSHNWSVEVSSEPGRGTTFTIGIP